MPRTITGLLVVALLAPLVGCGGSKPKPPVGTTVLPNDYMQRGNALAGKGDYRGAIREYDRALEIKSDFLMCRYNRGLAYNRIGSYEAAKKDFRICLQQRDDWLQPHIGICESLYLQSQYAAAIKEATQALKANPNIPELYFWRGVSHIASGQGPKGEEDLQRATRLQTSYAAAHFELGKFYLDNSRYDLAAKRFEAAIDSNYEPLVDALVNMGITAKEMGNLDAAVEYYKGAIRRAPSLAIPRALLGRAYLNRAEIARTNGHDEAFRREATLARDEFTAAADYATAAQGQVKEESLRGKAEAERLLALPRR